MKIYNDSREEIHYVALDIEEKELPDADFGDRDIRGYCFDKSILDRATFVYSQLKDVRFYRSSLNNAQFREASMEDCCFAHADLTGFCAEEAEILGCDFSFANLTRADLSHAILVECNFEGATLDDAVATCQDCGEVQQSLEFLVSNNFKCSTCMQKWGNIEEAIKKQFA